MNRRQYAEEAFWAMVDKGGPDDCWQWTGAVGPSGYGQKRLPRARKTVTSHYWSWNLSRPKGEGLPMSQKLKHTCGNKLCCNPDHMQRVYRSSGKPVVDEKLPPKRLPRRTPPPRDYGLPRAFWAHVECGSGSDCWEWVGTKSRGRSAHRWVYAKVYGPPRRGKAVIRTCGNKSCVNPKHLTVKESA